MQVQNVRTVLCVDINENLESMQCDPEQKWELECESAEPAGAHIVDVVFSMSILMPETADMPAAPLSSVALPGRALKPISIEL